MFGASLLAFVALAASVRASCLHGTSLLPRQEGGEVEVSGFSYTGGETGPFNWADLSPDNVACRTATVQSPINLDQTISFAAEPPVIDIQSVASAEYSNLGTTLETVVTGTTTVGGVEFTLKQFHKHSPSEHRVNEEYFPLEMHLVHEAADGSGSIAVIAVLFQLSEDGSTTELLTGVTQNLANVTQPGTRTTTGALDFGPLIAHVTSTPLFQYTGSLTTPPCKEGLTFLVTSEPLPIDVKTFNALKSVLKFNARYTQNTLGQQNLLDLAADLKIEALGLQEPGAGGEANVDENGNTSKEEVTSNVDVEQLVALLVKENKALRIDTVTKTVTKVVLNNDKNDNKNDNKEDEKDKEDKKEDDNKEGENKGEQEGENEEDKEEVPEPGAGGEEPPVDPKADPNAPVEPQAKPEPEPPVKPQAHAPVEPPTAPEEKQYRRVARSRLGRALLQRSGPGKRRL